MWGFLPRGGYIGAKCYKISGSWPVRERVGWDHLPGRQNSVNKGKKVGRSIMVYVLV